MTLPLVTGMTADSAGQQTAFRAAVGVTERTNRNSLTAFG